MRFEHTRLVVIRYATRRTLTSGEPARAGVRAAFRWLSAGFAS
jgi:hypothetical protein